MITPQEPIREGDVARHYDRLDRFYREIWGEHFHHGLWLTGRENARRAVEHLIERAVEPLALRPGDRICDVGCGNGATARHLVRRYGARVTGLTLSRTQFEVARELADEPANPEILLCSWECNDLAPESFDGVISIECLSHVREKLRFFREIHRVLKPGRQAVILDWMAGERPLNWEIRHLLQPICRDGNLAGLANSEDLAAIIADAGLQLVESEDLSDRVRKTWNILARRIAIHGVTRPSVWKFVLSRPVSSWRYLLTTLRILIAYRTGALRYGIVVIEKSE